MNWVDMLILVVLSVSAFSSLRAGFLRQTFAILGFIVGVYSALSYHLRLAQMLQDAVPQATLAKAVAFVLILVLVWVASAILAALACQVLSAAGLAWADRLFGMLLGLGVGLFIVISLLMLMARIPIAAISGSLEHSTLAPLILQLLPHLTQLFPSNLRLFKML